VVAGGVHAGLGSVPGCWGQSWPFAFKAFESG
jgi:hypothetical protein